MLADMARTGLDDVLEAVGPRLRALRADRGLTLAAVSGTTSPSSPSTIRRQKLPSSGTSVPVTMSGCSPGTSASVMRTTCSSPTNSDT